MLRSGGQGFKLSEILNIVRIKQANLRLENIGFEFLGFFVSGFGRNRSMFL